MENATRALLMAGGIFLAIVILVIAISLFVNYRNIVESYDKTTTMQEIAEINKKFEKYSNRNNITIQEVVTAAKIADNYNRIYGNGARVIDVYVGSYNITGYSKYTELIQKNIDQKYSVNYNVNINEATDIIYYNQPDDTYKGMVKQIKFNGSLNK